MPVYGLNLIQQPYPHPISVALEPVQVSFNNLALLTQADHMSGVSDWVVNTAASLSSEQRHTNTVVVNGLYYTIAPADSFKSFPNYIDYLAMQDPLIMRRRLFSAYSRINLLERKCECILDEVDFPEEEIEPLLQDFNAYLAFLMKHFEAKCINIEMESEAHALLNEPERMHEMIIEHLRSMWQQVLRQDWERTQPILKEAVESFRQVDFSGMTNLEAASVVTGREDFEDEVSLRDNLDQKEHFVFVPSVHIGPYLFALESKSTMWIIFGARQPEGAKKRSFDLSRAEMLVRLSALADDTRLRILRCIVEEGELSSNQLIERLDLSQSAASRHLKQLTATGFLVERRLQSAKYYKLNPKRVSGTLEAIGSFLDIE